MATRAKFRLNSYTTEMQQSYPHQKPEGGTDYQRPEMQEKRTLNFTPVMSGSEESKQFFSASPSGSIQLGVVNQEAWKEFELNVEYYVDFTRAK